MNLNDLTGNGNTLTNNNVIVSTDTPFVASTKSADFELSNSAHFTATDSVSLSITDDISIEAYINLEQLPSTVAAQFTIVSKYDTGANKRAYNFFIDSASDKLRFSVSDDGTIGAGHTITYTTATAFVADDLATWIHVAVTHDISSETCVFYIDGSADAPTVSAGSIGASMYDGNNNLSLGALLNSSVAERFFDGKMDEIRIWNDIRSGAEVAANYQAELTGAESGLAAYWNFDSSGIGALFYNQL